MCVYKIEKLRTLSATSEIASQFPSPLRSNETRHPDMLSHQGQNKKYSEISRKHYLKQNRNCFYYLCNMKQAKSIDLYSQPSLLTGAMGSVL
jgi:hypothetical protein